MRPIGVLTLGAVPLLAGAAIPLSAVQDGAVWCPFRALTGAPCPLCGATRAFVHAGHLDARWLDFGAVWVVVAVALVIAGLAGLAGVRLPRGRPAGTVVAATVAVVAVAWAWALAHAATIVA